MLTVVMPYAVNKVFLEKNNSNLTFANLNLISAVFQRSLSKK